MAERLPGRGARCDRVAGDVSGLPIFLRLSKHVVALQALGAGILLLIWLYVMANVIVFGAEVNWWLRRKNGDDVTGLA